MSSSLVYLTPPADEFETAYLDARSKENRLYPDEVVRQLPVLSSHHPQADEWRLRQKNIAALIAHLTNTGAQNILDLGCGNGWLTHQLISGKTDTQVLGMDVNAAELEQAQRLFARENCRFAYGDIFTAKIEQAPFDRIILASCAQYFPDLSALLDRLLELLTSNGEIHILDSPLYTQQTVEEARIRTQQYYKQQGVHSMQNHYHHHKWEDLKSYNSEILYDPTQLANKLKRKLGVRLSPFPWIIIRPST